MGWSDALKQFVLLVTLILKIAGERRSASRSASERKRDEQLGAGRAIAETIEDGITLIEKGRQARRSVRDRLRADPGSLYDGDQYERPAG